MPETIAALSTAAQKSGVAVIRISGELALETADKVFRTQGAKPWEPRQMRTGMLLNREGSIVDRAMAVWFKGPNSFTGEDVVEIHCHGSLAVINIVLSALYSNGARPASAGEFTKRAFLNGKLDLSQAEAVGDLIAAETEEAAINAAAQLGGALSRALVSIYDKLVDLLAHFQAVVDYPDEDIEAFGLEHACKILSDSSQRLMSLLEGYERGKILKEGIDCAIIGRPNVGKSSLMNALVGYDRAIVTPIAGTTRDVVEAYARVGGVILKLHDTAGIRITEDYIESIGIERAIKAVESAALVLAVIDGSQPLNEEDLQVLKNAVGKRAILIINKSDLIALDGLENEAEIQGNLNGYPNNQVEKMVLAIYKSDGILNRFSKILPISAKTGEGLDALDATVRSMYASGDLRLDGTVITNARQEGACRTAAEALRAAHSALNNGYPPDMVLYDVEQGMERIGEILGKNTPADVIDRIFANFCVGK